MLQLEPEARMFADLFDIADDDQRRRLQALGWARLDRPDGVHWKSPGGVTMHEDAAFAQLGRAGADGPVPPAQAHSPTSRAAAGDIAPLAPAMRQRVLAALRAHPGGLTDEELQHLLGMNPSSLRPRRVELVEAGLVSDSGRTRPTASGRRAVVWVAAEVLEGEAD